MSKTLTKGTPAKATASRINENDRERPEGLDDDSPEMNLGKAPPFPGWPLLYAKNLDEVRRWYRNATNAGREMKHIVLCEMIFSHAANALALALQGKQWSPPQHLP
jgi:hypothetical protein